MSSSRKRNQAAQARASRALQRNEANIIGDIDEKRTGKTKPLTPPSKQLVTESKQPEPARENPYTRLLRRLDADNGRR